MNRLFSALLLCLLLVPIVGESQTGTPVWTFQDGFGHPIPFKRATITPIFQVAYGQTNYFNGIPTNLVSDGAGNVQATLQLGYGYTVQIQDRNGTTVTNFFPVGLSNQVFSAAQFPLIATNAGGVNANSTAPSIAQVQNFAAGLTSQNGSVTIVATPGSIGTAYDLAAQGGSATNVVTADSPTIILTGNGSSTSPITATISNVPLSALPMAISTNQQIFRLIIFQSGYGTNQSTYTNAFWFWNGLTPTNLFLMSKLPVFQDTNSTANDLLRDPAIFFYKGTYYATWSHYPLGGSGKQTEGIGVASSPDGYNFTFLGYGNVTNTYHPRGSGTAWSPRYGMNGTNIFIIFSLGTPSGTTPTNYFIADVNPTNLLLYSNFRPLIVTNDLDASTHWGGSLLYCSNNIGYFFTQEGNEYTNSLIGGIPSTGWIWVYPLNYNNVGAGNLPTACSLIYSGGLYYLIGSSLSSQGMQYETSTDLINWSPDLNDPDILELTYAAHPNISEASGDGTVFPLPVSNSGNGGVGLSVQNALTATGDSPIDGASLTNLNASQIASGTVPTARLGTGTANSSTFLRGDNTWASPGSASFDNGTGNSTAQTNLSLYASLFYGSGGTNVIVQTTNQTLIIGPVGTAGISNGVFYGSVAGASNIPAGQLNGTVPVAQLPTATASTLGIVKPDNSSITISGGVISATGTGSGNASTNVAQNWLSAQQLTNAGNTISGTAVNLIIPATLIVGGTNISVKIYLDAAGSTISSNLSNSTYAKTDTNYNQTYSSITAGSTTYSNNIGQTILLAPQTGTGVSVVELDANNHLITNAIPSGGGGGGVAFYATNWASMSVTKGANLQPSAPGILFSNYGSGIVVGAYTESTLHGTITTAGFLTTNQVIARVGWASVSGQQCFDVCTNGVDTGIHVGGYAFGVGNLGTEFVGIGEVICPASTVITIVGDANENSASITIGDYYLGVFEK